jgi:hypothetical protein
MTPPVPPERCAQNYDLVAMSAEEYKQLEQCCRREARHHGFRLWKTRRRIGCRTARRYRLIHVASGKELCTEHAGVRMNLADIARWILDDLDMTHP